MSGFSEDDFNRESKEDANSRQRENAKGRKSYSLDAHRLLPQSPDAEKGILSSVIQAPTRVLPVAQSLGVCEDSFFIPAHRIIWEQFLELLNEGGNPDFITLTQRLRDKDLLSQCGGAAFITELFTFLPTVHNAGYYSEILEEKLLLREMIRICTEIAARAYDEQDEVHPLLEELEMAVSKLSLRRFKRRKRTLKDAVVTALEKCDAGKTEEAWGLASGYAALDSVIRGFGAGNMFAIGGETSSGKTSLMLNFIHNLCVKRGIPSLIFSLEMTTDEVTEVLLQIGSGSNIDAVAERRVGDPEIKAFRTAGERLAVAPLVIHDEEDLSILQARSIARNLKPRIIALDYAQLMTGGKKKYERSDLEIADISRGAKKMARELDATVFLLTQLNDLGKVAGSRAIVKDADQLLIVSGEGEEEKWVQVCKQRRGKRDKVPFRWIGACQKFLSKPLT